MLGDQLTGVEGLCRHLQALGLKAKRVPAAGERGVLELLDGSGEAIALTGRKVKLVQLKVGGAIWFLDGSPPIQDLRIGPLPIYSARPMPVQAHWVVPVDPAGAPDDYAAKLKTRRSGFLWRGPITGAEWTGGRLAEALQKDPERTLALARGLVVRESLEVRPDVDRACVRVIHQTRLVMKFSLLSAEVFDVDRRMPSQALVDGIEWVAGVIQRLRKQPRKKAAPKKRKGRSGARPRG